MLLFLVVPLLKLKTAFATFNIDRSGYLSSIQSRDPALEYVAKNHRSPLLSLQSAGKEILPIAASYRPTLHLLTIRYPNSATANVSVQVLGPYVRLKLLSLKNRQNVDNIVWGPIHTTISKTIGDMIGVVRDGGWAIGMLALNDNTSQGPPSPSDLGQMYYYIHSPDPVKYPVPPQYHEGERFSIGGDGRSDVAFYSHPEEYFHMGWESGALLEPGSGSVLAYHSRDRRKPRNIFFTLIPGLPADQPRHQRVDPVDADFIGSSVALYACPDNLGLKVLREITYRENLAHQEIDGVWVKNPASFKPDIAWYGLHGHLLEYAQALGLHAVQDEGMGEFYMDPADSWTEHRVQLDRTRSTSIRQFADRLAAHGVLYGLHTLCMFIRPSSIDVHPVPNPHLQTVLRTKLAQPVSAAETAIVVTDPSFLAEKGTWHENDINVLRIGTELLTYDGISKCAPWTLQQVRRGQYGTRASAHAAGDELVKLQINCYQGFAPDMKLLLHYADLYAHRLNDLGMQYIDFDGFESCMYQNQGDYAFKLFLRRLFETYHQLTHGKYLRVMGSCVCEGNWHYLSICNVGGGQNMFDPVTNRWGIEGKDIRYQFQSSYFPATFGIQDYRSDWSAYDAENLEAKSIGWNATYALGLSQEAVEKSGEKQAIFKAFRTWEDARAAGVFKDAVKERLKDLGCKFHLQRLANRSFLLTPVHEMNFELKPGQAHAISISNPYKPQPLQFALQFTAIDARPASLTVTLPDGQILAAPNMQPGQFIICKGDRAYISNRFRAEIAPLNFKRPAQLPRGPGPIKLNFQSRALAAALHFTAWAAATPILIRGRSSGS